MRKPILIAILFYLLFSMPTLLADDLTPQRAVFVQAELAFKKNDLKTYSALAKKIPDYPLYSYLRYEELKRNIKSMPIKDSLTGLHTFEKRYPDFPFQDILRTQWLMRAANKKNWSEFIKGYRPTDNEELQCYYHYAQYQLSGEISHLEQAKPLWLVAYSQPNSCELLFNAWSKSGKLTKKLIWERYQLALEHKNFNLAQYLTKYFTVQEQLVAKQWETVTKNPALITHKKFMTHLEGTVNTKVNMLAQALGQLTRKNPHAASTWWKQHAQEFPFSKSQTAQIQRDIGVFLSHQKHPLASKWLNGLSAASLDSVAQEWRVRLALASEDWPNVLKWIEQLPTEAKEEKAWEYWQARALEATGQKKEAHAIYEKLAPTRTYYGFLASGRIKQPISLQHQPMAHDEVVYQKVQALPGIRRFEQLQILGRTSFARIEWFYALKKLNSDEIVAAAKIAHKMGLHDIAIFTMAKSKHLDDVHVRFPLAHQAEIVRHANKHHLDPAWVFAVARQESAFFNHAVSSAGARGLMQLRHSTAQELATKNEINYASEDALHQPLTNVQLGTLYLKNLKQRMQNHLVLATASYNAGPTPINRWLPKDKPLDADIWIETIPYKETREYVKNVLVFTSIYRQRLGTPSTLGLMMKPIPPKVSSKK